MARRFLFTTWEGGGNIPPVLAVVRKLVAGGHHVRVMSDACNADDFARPGVEFRCWERAPSRPDRSPANDPVKDWLAPDPAAGIVRTLDAIVTGPALAYAEDVIDELRRQPADLVVTSELLLGVAAGCEAIGQPFAMLTANISLFPLPGVPPMGPGLTPATNAEERARHAAIARQMEALLDHGLPALNTARERLGLSPLAHLADQVRVARAVLLGTARAFDFAPDALPPGVAYVGPQMETPGWAAALPDAAGDEGAPLVAICFSTTFQNQEAALQRVMNAVGRLPARGVVTLGPALDGDGLRPPANVAVLASADHDALMRQSAVVVTHGGHGTVMRALMHGKPMLVMPQGRDQADNAARVAARGAGLALAPDAASENVARAIERLLSEESFARQARALGAAVTREAQDSRVAEVLEGLARREPVSLGGAAG